MDILRDTKFENTVIRVVRGDLTESNVDAIVNPANSRLQHGGGVAGAIVRKGGSIIQEESNRIGHVPVGQSVLTLAGRLKARFVIHTVGPRWGEGDEEKKLARAVQGALRLASDKGFKSISIPAISGGIFGFPKEQCAGIIIGETVSYLKHNKTSLEEVNFYLMDEEFIHLFEQNLSLLASMEGN